MKRYYLGQKVFLRKNFKMGKVVKKLTDKNKYLVSFYCENRLVYDVISPSDIIDEEEYQIIRNRINTINRLID